MKITNLERKKFRVRNKLKKVSPKDRYRLCVSRSIKNISAQIIDDTRNITLASASSNKKDIKSKKKKQKRIINISCRRIIKKSERVKNYKSIFW